MRRQLSVSSRLAGNYDWPGLAQACQLTRTIKRDGKETVSDFVVAWTNTYNGKTKVFATTLGHNNALVGDAHYLDLVAHGLLWSVGKLDDAHRKPAARVLINPDTIPK